MSKNMNAAQAGAAVTSATNRARSEAIDTLCATVTKARALSVMTCGEGGETFRRMNDTLQDEYLWALSGLLDDAVLISMQP